MMKTTQKETRYEHKSAVLVVHESTAAAGGLREATTTRVTVVNKKGDGKASWHGSLAEVDDLAEALQELGVVLDPLLHPTPERPARKDKGTQPTLNGAEPTLKVEADGFSIDDLPPHRPCRWRAGDCQGTAMHLVTLRGSFLTSDPALAKGVGNTTLPMCDRCAAIHDPALGAVGGYVHTFVSRRNLALDLENLASPASPGRPSAEPPRPTEDEVVVTLSLTKFRDLLDAANDIIKLHGSETSLESLRAVALARLVNGALGGERVTGYERDNLDDAAPRGG